MKKEFNHDNLSYTSPVANIIATVRAITPMPDTDIELLVSILEKRTIKKNDFLLKEGDVAENVFFLIEGFFRMYYIDFNGNEINYRFTRKGNFLADFQSLLTQKASQFYWQALQDSELFVLPYHKIQDAYASSAAWSRFGRLMAERVYLQLNQRVELLLFKTPEERYLHILETEPQLLSEISQFHLASYLGVKPESLSRLRKRIAKK